MQENLTDNAVVLEALDDYVEAIQRRAEGQGTFRAVIEARVAIKALLAAQSAEISALKADYLRACQTVAAMHEAATGRTGEAPTLGVVEDVAAVRKAGQQALEALEHIQEADTAGATPTMVVQARKLYAPTIEALRAAIAQATQS